MAEKEYYEREALKILFAGACAECRDSCAEFDGIEADCNQCLLNGVIKDAKSIPAADVRPVVLCRDCVYLSHDKYGAWCINNYEANLKDDDFCSHGKRKEKQT